MPNNESLIPGDPQAIREIGVKAWRESFLCPVSDQAFHEMTGRALAAFDADYAGLEGRERDAFLADSSFMFFMFQHLNTLAMESGARQAGRRYVTGKQAKAFHEPDWSAVGASFESAPTPLRLLKLKARSVVKHARFGAEPAPLRIAAALTGGKSLSIGSHQRLKSEYIDANGIRCSFPYVDSLIGGRRAVAPLPAKLAEAARHVVEAAGRGLGEMFGADLKVEALVKAWHSRLADLLAIYDGVAARRRDVERVLLSEVSKPLHKIVSLAMRSRGARVVGFHHGNNMGNSLNPYSGYIEYAHCDEYVCPTTAASRNHARIYAASGISAMEPVEFTSTRTRWYMDFMERAAASPPPAKVERVMVIGNPMTAIRYVASHADYFLFMLDFELRLMERLKERGFKVIYKAHPETLEGISDLVGGFCDEINTEPFEKVWHQGDAFVFGCTETTIFGTSLCMPRPVAILNLSSRKWNEGVFDLIAKRCIVSPAGFGEGQRVEPDWDALLDGIERAGGLPDYSYVREMMFSEPEDLKEPA